MAFREYSYIVFQAYGSQDILNECVFALLTLCHHHSQHELDNLKICIYTDQPAFFESFKNSRLDIEFREISKQLLAEWRGAIDFVHRVKIEVLRDFVKDKTGNILYLDTDVYFSRPITEIFDNIHEGKLYMHVMEDQVHHSDNIVFQKLSRFLKNNVIDVNGAVVNIPEQVAMWNAGVLGFHTKYAHLLDEVIAFTDTVHQQYPKHVVEQFAFSLYFQQTAPLLTAHTFIYHYWNLKELRPVLDSFFSFFNEKNWDGLVYYSKLIQLPDYLQQKANFYYNRSVFNKFLKKKWHPKLPEWNLLMQQL